MVEYSEFGPERELSSLPISTDDLPIHSLEISSDKLLLYRDVFLVVYQDQTELENDIIRLYKWRQNQPEWRGVFFTIHSHSVETAPLLKQIGHLKLHLGRPKVPQFYLIHKDRGSRRLEMERDMPVGIDVYVDTPVDP
jgi:hypothetical protein